MSTVAHAGGFDRELAETLAMLGRRQRARRYLRHAHAHGALSLSPKPVDLVPHTPSDGAPDHWQAREKEALESDRRAFQAEKDTFLMTRMAAAERQLERSGHTQATQAAEIAVLRAELKTVKAASERSEQVATEALTRTLVVKRTIAATVGWLASMVATVFAWAAMGAFWFVGASIVEEVVGKATREQTLATLADLISFSTITQWPSLVAAMCGVGVGRLAYVGTKAAVTHLLEPSS